jgi:hypothetical protein
VIAYLPTFTTSRPLAFVPPVLLTLVAAFTGPRHVAPRRETRRLSRDPVLEDGQARIFTRPGHDYTTRVPGIVEELAALPCRSAVIDAEAVFLALAKRTGPR